MLAHRMLAIYFALNITSLLKSKPFYTSNCSLAKQMPKKQQAQLLQLDRNFHSTGISEDSEFPQIGNFHRSEIPTAIDGTQALN